MDQWDVHMDLPPGVDLPAIQRLVGAGVSLANQYCTVPQCTPSRATMWTGQHAKNVGLWDNTNFAWTDVLSDEVPTAGTMLREQGYRSEEHTSELQSRGHLVCRLLLEKKALDT